MDRHGSEREEADEPRVPVEDARLAAGAEVREQGHAPQTVLPDGYAADEVAQRRAEDSPPAAPTRP